MQAKKKKNQARYPSSISAPSTSFTILSWGGGSLELDVRRAKGSLLISKLLLDVLFFAELALMIDIAAAIKRSKLTNLGRKEKL